MIILDTHAWVWWVSEPERLSDLARTAIDRATEIGICPISCWELATKAAKGKLTLDRDVEVWTKQALAHPRIRIVDFSPEIAVRAGLLGQCGFHGDPADRMIAASAMFHGVAVITKDRLLRSHEELRTVW